MDFETACKGLQPYYEVFLAGIEEGLVKKLTHPSATTDDFLEIKHQLALLKYIARTVENTTDE